MTVLLLALIAVGVTVMASETLAFAVIKLRARRVELRRARALVRAHAKLVDDDANLPTMDGS